ncbi:hypothetical protein K457DRAFT_13108 [Linnemannia elongata AG-77]|uniref:Uncharacterized protein n=1 Tax=Linnemannia elongata AG-77 TaxID=1314771 RepID=A0A197KDT8_9FUNG|nr:hypothetical protein K457DRAFT_13108 [Linnemannia elongata AG-77]
MRAGIIQWFVLGIVVLETTCKTAALPAAKSHTRTARPSPIHRRPNPLLPPNTTTTNTITATFSPTSPSSPTTSFPTASSSSPSATALTNLGFMKNSAPEMAIYDEHTVVRFNIRTEEQL